jgi:hypothetical protein
MAAAAAHAAAALVVVEVVMVRAIDPMVPGAVPVAVAGGLVVLVVVWIAASSAAVAKLELLPPNPEKEDRLGDVAAVGDTPLRTGVPGAAWLPPSAFSPLLLLLPS